MALQFPLETFSSGVGGHVVSARRIGAPAYVINEWELERMFRLAEITVSSSVRVRRGNVIQDGTYRINVPYNLSNPPETAGFGAGNSLSAATFLLGSSGQGYGPVALITEKNNIVNNVDRDFIRLVNSGFLQDETTDLLVGGPTIFVF